MCLGATPRYSGYPTGAFALMLAALIASVSGCQAHRPPSTTIHPAATQNVLHPWPSLNARVDPPPGWQRQPLKQDSRHSHEIWISPTGRTAYGVIYFHMPLPLSADFVLPFFMEAMRIKEGNAELLWRAFDPTLPGMRFEAIGGIYQIQANLITAGFHGWAIYAGRLRNAPPDQTELRQARAARDRTRVGVK